MLNKANEAQDKRRMFILLLIFSGCIALWLLRLFWLQLISASSFVSDKQVHLLHSSVNQRMLDIVIDSGRGDIFDRHMQPMTGSWIRTLVVFPLNRSSSPDSIEKWKALAELLNVEYEQLKSFIDHLHEPRWWMDDEGRQPLAIQPEQERKIRSLQLEGVEVIDLKLRYTQQAIAQQLIGFIGENPQRLKRLYAAQLERGKISVTSPIGGSGLELTFETLLKGVGSTRLSIFTDAHGRYMEGLGVRVMGMNSNPYYPVKLITTLDEAIQRQVEHLLDQHHVKEGAVVILDAASADIIVMASRPHFDPYKVEPLEANWNNRALKAIVPGSIFKTVVAAAALEAKVVTEDELFHCDGELGRYGFTCWKKSGHGAITMKEAFAQSCNIAFAHLSERLTANQLLATAQQLGLNRAVGWSGSLPGHPIFHQLHAEEKGQIFDIHTEPSDPGVMVQTSIGQRDVRMSVLQAANLIVSIINQGEVRNPRIAKEIRYQNNGLMHKFHENKMVMKNHGISRKTANLLRQWMEETVSDGTAKALNSSIWRLAGKTGTAQVRSLDKELFNQWFIGYGPVDSPRYAIAVAVERIPSDQPIAISLVKDIMDLLAQPL